MYLKYFIAWFGIVIVAFAIATIRQLVYARYFSELTAHQLATSTICVLVGAHVWLLSNYLKLRSPGQAIGVGMMWLVMTTVFETVFGHYVLGNAWSQVLRAYNVVEGRVWLVFLL